MPYLAEMQGFSAALIGVLSSCYFYSYGFSQNVWGVINDRVGPLRSCAAGMFMGGLGSLVAIISPTPLFIATSRIFCGLGFGAVFSAIYLYTAISFPPEEYPFWVGIFQVFGNLGTVVAVSPIGALIDLVGYTGLNIILASVAFLMSLAFWKFRIHLPPLPCRDTDKQGILPVGIISLVRDAGKVLKLVFADHRLRIAVFIWCASCASLQTLQGLWGVSWIAASSGASIKDARFWTTLIGVGLVVGSPLGSTATRIIDSNEKRLTHLLSALSFSWIAYMAVSFLSRSAPWMGVSGFLIGLLSAIVFVYCGNAIKTLAPEGYAGAVIGTANMMIFLSLIVFQILTGLIINMFPGMESHSYQNQGFVIAFIPILISVVASSLSVSTVSHPQEEQC